MQILYLSKKNYSILELTRLLYDFMMRIFYFVLQTCNFAHRISSIPPTNSFFLSLFHKIQHTDHLGLPPDPFSEFPYPPSRGSPLL